MGDKKGFTLIETLVAITIFAAILTTFTSLTLTSSRVLEAAKRKYIATKIAEEGIELVINKRDTAMLCAEDDDCPFVTPDPGDWQKRLAGPNDGDVRSWLVDATDLASQEANGNYNPYVDSRYLCQNNTGRFYYCNNDPDYVVSGNFKRRIEVTKVDDAKLKVKSIVQWVNRGDNESLSLETVLFGLPLE